jgi:hypothetical protein
MVASKASKKNAQKKKQFPFVPVHFLALPKARTMGTGILSDCPPMSMFCSDLCFCAPHSPLETEHNSQNPSDQPHHLGCRRNARQIRSSGQSCAMQLWGRGGNHKLVVGDLDGTEGVVLLTEPVEIRWVSAGRSSRSAAASETDGEPDGCGSPSATDSRRRLMIQFRCIKTKRD